MDINGYHRFLQSDCHVKIWKTAVAHLSTAGSPLHPKLSRRRWDSLPAAAGAKSPGGAKFRFLRTKGNCTKQSPGKYQTLMHVHLHTQICHDHWEEKLAGKFEQDLEMLRMPSGTPRRLLPFVGVFLLIHLFHDPVEEWLVEQQVVPVDTKRTLSQPALLAQH